MGTKQRLSAGFKGLYQVRAYVLHNGYNSNYSELAVCDDLGAAVDILNTCFRLVAAICRLRDEDVSKIAGYMLQVVCVRDSKGNTVKTAEGEPCILAETFVKKPATRPLATSKYKR